MSGEIYIDVVFGANLLMDYILLRVLGMALGLRRRPGRCLAAALVGALFSCLVLWFPKEAFPAAVILHGLCAAGMIRIGFGVKKGALLLNTVFMLYAAAFLWGGFREALEDGEGSVRTFLLCALCVYAGTGAAVCVGDAFRIRRKNIYPVTLSWHGKKQDVYGFYDTGNLLTDPVNGSPVSVAEADALKKILSEELTVRLKHLKENPGELECTEIVGLRPRYLSCSTVGQKQCLMLTVTLDELCIRAPGEEVRIKKPVIALAFEPSALGKEYKVLLNSRLLH
ncbi:MAG TPA: sigma-E processing peptidase SpoIIGA [Candidatus Blautia excrementigallinarum]|nr:sigma-E processing peptidase SpoIIGA [Candidatus Blautia excrementigallinarum]